MQSWLTAFLSAPWRAVAAMFVLNGALLGIWASRIPAVAEIHALGHSLLGLLLLMLAAGAIAAFPVAGRVADRYGAAAMTRLIAILYVVALLVLAIAPTTPLLAVALFIFGATHGAMDVTMNTWAGEAERKIGRPVMSSFHAMFSVGLGLGAATGDLAVRHDLGIPAHFACAALPIAIVTLWLARIDWTMAQQEPQTDGPLFAFPKGALALVGVVAFCSSLGEGAMIDWAAVFLVSVAGADEASAAIGLSVFALAMAVTRFLGDAVVARIGPVAAARCAGAVAATGVASAILTGTFPGAILGFALMGVGYAVVVPLAFSRAANDPGQSPGRAIASVATLGYGGLLLGPPVIGFIADATSLRIAFGVLFCLAVTIVGLAGSLRRQV